MINNQIKHHNKLLKHLSNNLICPKCNKKVNRVNKIKKLSCKCQKLFIIKDIYDNNSTRIFFSENNIRMRYFKPLKYYYFEYYLTSKYETAIIGLNVDDLFPINSFINFNLMSNLLNKVIKFLYKLEKNMLFY